MAALSSSLPTSASRRLSISELTRSPSTSHVDCDPISARSVSTTFCILKAPAGPLKRSTGSAAQSPAAYSPRHGLASPYSLGGRSPLFGGVHLPESAKRDADESMPRTPKWLSSEQVYKELGDDADSSGEQVDAMEPLDDDIYLPYRDRKAEAKEVFDRPHNKALVTLLKSDRESYSRLLKVMSIDRDLMSDLQWIAELKAIVHPRSESLWERLRSCLGIDGEDALDLDEIPRTPAFFCEPLLSGDPVIENDRARLEVLRASGIASPVTSTASLPFLLDEEASEEEQTSPRRGRNGSSGGSSGHRVAFAMSTIAESDSFFPPATEPPKRIDMASLQEQERRLNESSQANWAPPIRSRSSKLSLASSVVSEDPEEDGFTPHTTPGLLSRSGSHNSIESSPGRKLRGLRFTSMSEPRPKSVTSLKSQAIDSDDESLAESPSAPSPLFMTETESISSVVHSWSLNRTGPAILT